MKLVAKINGKEYRERNELCRNCFHICSSADVLLAHQKSCLENDSLQITMPDSANNKLKFENYAARWFSPFVVYLDLESLLLPVATAKSNPMTSSTCALEHHLPCSYCLIVVEHNNPEPIHFDIYTGPDFMKRFITKIEKLARFFYHQKRKFPKFIGAAPLQSTFSRCWICDVAFNNDNEKVLDHCHYSGQFIGYAHVECNLKRRTLNFTPVIARNMMNYDLHHIVKSLHTASESTKIEVIPTNDEKFIALNFGVFIETRKRKQDEVTVYEYMRFIDSFKFMPCSLDKIVQTLPHNKFSILDNFYRGYTTEQRNLLKKKGSFPYSYVNDFSKLRELSLPSLENWKNSLKDNKIDVTSEELNQLNFVFYEFNCQSLKEFLELYLTGDVLQLSCWFEELRSVCYDTHGLDCAQFYTASNLSGNAFLKTCQPEIELLTDRLILEMAEKMIRGGLSSIYSSSLEIANNTLLPNFDSSKEVSSIIYIDANNLYGGIMLHFPLPLNQFELIEDVALETILQTDDEGDVGFIVEVDLEYPDALHDEHADYPLIPDKEPIDTLELSDYQTTLISALSLTSSKSSKLRQTFHPKKNYVVHYLNLKFYVDSGIKVTRVHRAVKFHQSKWLASYIALNTQKRQEASSKLDQDFYKLMSNSTFGKLCESLRNRVSVKFVRTEEELLKTTSKGNISSIKIIDENLTIITKKVQSIVWNKPTIIGASILELSKLFMLDFHYNVMKKQTECSLLYSDTDSFVYKVKTNSFYDDLTKNSTLKKHFDLSNFPSDHKLYNKTNAKVVLKFKDELAGTPIEEFCALKPKLYSIVASNGENKMSAKGTKKFAQAKLNHEMFKETLETSNVVRLENIKISTVKHKLQTVCLNKIALCAYDDKRYINTDKKTTLPFGHFSLRDEYVSKKLCAETDWEDELNEPCNVFELPEGGEASGWEIPDPGFHQPSYSNEELNDVIDLLNLSEQSDESDQEINNPFILNEADENPDCCSSSSENATLASISNKKKQATLSNNLLRQIDSVESTNSSEVTLSENEESPVISIKRARAYIVDSDIE